MSTITPRAARPINPRIAESAAHRSPALAMPLDEIRNGGASESAADQVERLGRAALKIPIALIEPDPDQPRKRFDAEGLQRLATSIGRTGGLLTPIRVRKPTEPGGKYRIIAGECRWQASGIAGMTHLDCIVDERGERTRADVLADQITENAVRSDLRPMELARAYAELKRERGISGNQLAKELGISQTSLSDSDILLTTPAEVQDAIDEGSYPTSAALAASGLEHPRQLQILAEYVAGNLKSRAEVKERVREIREAEPVAPAVEVRAPKVGRPPGSRGASPRARTKGSGSKSKPLPSSVSRRVPTGHKVTVEHRKGVDRDGMIAALEVLAEDLRAERRAEQGGEAEAA